MTTRLGVSRAVSGESLKKSKGKEGIGGYHQVGHIQRVSCRDALTGSLTHNTRYVYSDSVSTFHPHCRKNDVNECQNDIALGSDYLDMTDKARFCTCLLHL